MGTGTESALAGEVRRGRINGKSCQRNVGLNSMATQCLQKGLLTNPCCYYGIGLEYALH